MPQGGEYFLFTQTELNQKIIVSVAAFFIPAIFPGMTGGGGFGLGSVPWWFIGIILAAANSLFGPAMQAFVILRIIKIWRRGYNSIR